MHFRWDLWRQFFREEVNSNGESKVKVWESVIKFVERSVHEDNKYNIMAGDIPQPLLEAAKVLLLLLKCLAKKYYNKTVLSLMHIKISP